MKIIIFTDYRRCYCGIGDGARSTLISIEQSRGGLYSYNYSVRHTYDVIAPTHDDIRIVNATELRNLLSNVPNEAFDSVSYASTNSINEKNRDKADLIFSYLKQKPKVLYVAFKADGYEHRSNRKIFSTLKKRSLHTCLRHPEQKRRCPGDSAFSSTKVMPP